MSRDMKLPGGAPNVSSVRLLATMGGAGAIAGLLIVVVYQFTLPTVLANRAARLETAIHQVLPGSARHETLYLVDGALTASLPAGLDARKVEKIYAGVNEAGASTGYALPGSQAGFQDNIEIIVGFDPSTDGTLGLVILSSRETPGLGDKIEAPGWLGQFTSRRVPLAGVKAGASSAPGEVEMITGATISSRTVIDAINKTIERWKPLIGAYAGGRP